jgi:N-acetyl-gamma-glutamyl-phosphate reductase
MFTPHLIPMNRGILTTAYARLQGFGRSDVAEAFQRCYGSEHFIRLLPEGTYPSTHRVRGSNFVEIGWYVEEETGQVVVMSAIDNLTKGASGQAVQNMNIMMGIPEGEGIDFPALWP